MPAVAALAGDLAARYAGTRSDVLRLAVPPRHAATERAAAVPAARTWAVRRGGGRDRLGRAPAGRGLPAPAGRGGVPASRLGRRPPGADWPMLLAHAAAAAYAGSGRGVLVCVPDAKDVVRVDRALTRCWGRASTSA